ncbi:hypothetical protein TcasGA2_TC031019 [Tribolium castaneum]|uniref:Uncharacterized protein n=1 Tax=Tribolium castaneum TaxID=7070 RepID=A0A139W8R4_TRICA|nr:hypothetical protein TcasGA2_TC031019 [Tribolium castaneum]
METGKTTWRWTGLQVTDTEDRKRLRYKNALNMNMADSKNNPRAGPLKGGIPSSELTDAASTDTGEALLVNSIAVGYSWEDAPDPFNRRSSIQRTPPSKSELKQGENFENVFDTPKESKPEVTNMQEGEWQDEKIFTSSISTLYEKDNENESALLKKNIRSPLKKKRKREVRESDEAEGIDKEMTAVSAAMENLNKKIEELKMQEQFGTVPQKRCSIPSLNETEEKDEEVYTRNISTQDVGVQADENEIKQEVWQRNEEIYRKVETAIEEETGWTGLEKVINEKWPPKCFKNTDLLELQTLKELRGDAAIIIYPDKTLTITVKENLKYNYPEIEAVMKDELREGNVECIKTNMETILKKGGKETTSRILYVIPYQINEDGVNDMAKLYESIQILKDETIIQDTKQVKIAPFGNLDNMYIRKCTDYVFRGSDKE